MQGGLLGMVPFDPMGQISDKNRQSEVRNGRCVPPSSSWILELKPALRAAWPKVMHTSRAPAIAPPKLFEVSMPDHHPHH